MGKPENVLDRLQESVSSIFDQVQSSLANHRKNCVALHKLHQRAAAVTRPAKDGVSVKLVGERKFGDVFIDLTSRVLVIKKGPAAADRVMRFAGAYIKFLNEKALSEKDQRCDPSYSISTCGRNADDNDEDTFASRFVSRLLHWLLEGFVTKNKNVRYRCVAFVSEMITHLGEIEEDTYNILRNSLVERINDKESLIRPHAVVALSKLVGTEDLDDVEDGERTILEILVEVMCYDPFAEVRRAALLSIPILPSTLGIILSRTRDTDSLNRRVVYSGVVQPKLSHPRQLNIGQREQLIKDGLGDREPGVRVAAGKLVASWFDVVMSEKDGDELEGWTGDDGGIMKGLIKFLSLFDVVGPGLVVAVDAMLSVLVTRPDILEVVAFEDAFWKNLTPESAVFARIFVEHCMDTKSEMKLEVASLPVVTAFAFHLQEYYNTMLDILQEMENARFIQEDEDNDEAEFREEELAKAETVLSELLRIALRLDFMDEVGRRKLYTVVRDMLAHPELPPSLIEPAMDILKGITPTERELVRVIVEIIVEFREGEKQETTALNDASLFDANASSSALAQEQPSRCVKTREEMSPEERMEADVTDLRSLTLCIAMLSRVHGTFEDNSSLEGVLTDLIIPAVRRKELAMREKGLMCLGLCCLIAKDLALGSFQLFLSQVQNAPPNLKIGVVQVIFDLLVVHEVDFIQRSEDIAKKIIDFLLQTLETEDSPSVQAALCIGFAKLVLANIITDARILTRLAITYISPTTTDNQELRQCLSYFFPVYCYSSPLNQSRMRSVFITAYDLSTKLHDSLEEDETMVTPYQFGLLMIDWTDPRKLAKIIDHTEHEAHTDLAVDILAQLYDPERSNEDLKNFCLFLGQLYIHPDTQARSVSKLYLLLQHHDEQCPFQDASIIKLFHRFKNRIYRLFEDKLKEVDPATFADDEEFRELYNLIGIDMLEVYQPSQAKIPSREGDQPTETGATMHEDESSAEDVPSSPTPSPKKMRQQQAPKPGVRKSVAGENPHNTASENEAGCGADAVAPQTETPKWKGSKRVLTPDSKSPNSKRAKRKKAIEKRAVVKTGIPQRRSTRGKTIVEPTDEEGAGSDS